VQHDPNIADGLSGLKAFAAEIASSPTSNVTIYRTLVDGETVMLHSKYHRSKSISRSRLQARPARLLGAGHRLRPVSSASKSVTRREL
jgi:hypothetical protein